MYVLRLTDQSARKKAVLIKIKSTSMERLLDGLEAFVAEKNGVSLKGVKENGKI